MWVDPEDDPRDGRPNPIGERETLIEYLRHYRLTLEMKCADLDAGQLARRSVPPSTMSLQYARHLGHADLLRECIDGRTGQ
jgi:hypothetical protein